MADWKGPLEAAIYLEAVRQNPRRDDEVPWAYLQRISEVVKADMGQQATESWQEDWRGTKD